MTVASLRDLHRCFEGAVPAVIATASSDGTPNVTYLSKVRYVDDLHVALSNQFFSKTAANVRQNPRAQVTVLHPKNGRNVRLSVRYLRSETEGNLFEEMRAEIDAIASIMGMRDVFRLSSADVYVVEQGYFVPCDLDG